MRAVAVDWAVRLVCSGSGNGRRSAFPDNTKSKTCRFADPLYKQEPKLTYKAQLNLNNYHQIHSQWRLMKSLNKLCEKLQKLCMGRAWFNNCVRRQCRGIWRGKFFRIFWPAINVSIVDNCFVEDASPVQPLLDGGNSDQGKLDEVKRPGNRPKMIGGATYAIRRFWRSLYSQMSVLQRGALAPLQQLP